MSIPLLVSYVVLWVLVVALAVFLLGTMRELAAMRAKRSAAGPVADDGPPIGSQLPRLMVSPVNGRTDSMLGEYAGPLGTFLVMLSPLCESCQDLVSAVNAISRLYGDQVGIVAVLDADAGIGRSFMAMFPLAVPTVLDNTGEVTRALNVVNKPSGLLYDSGDLLAAKTALVDEGKLKEVLDDLACTSKKS